MILNKNNLKLDLVNFIQLQKYKGILRFLTCGSVDDGKSTLIGRLLYDTCQIYSDQILTLKNDSKRIGTQGKKLDMALLVDGLQSEREQGITIDVAYRYFFTNKRKFIIADTPGHDQYTKNMATGASNCFLSILLIDATKGVLDQTRRHSFLSSLLGIRYLVVCINKMDIINYSEKVFNSIKNQYLNFVSKLPNNVKLFFIPISALEGDNVVKKTQNIFWYYGPTLLDILESVELFIYNKQLVRFPIQFVSRPSANFRGYMGTLLSGCLYVNQKIKILPSLNYSYIDKIITFDGNLPYALPGDSVSLVFKNNLDISRGDILVDYNDKINLSCYLLLYLVWMSTTPLIIGHSYNLKIYGKYVSVHILNIKCKININNFVKKSVDHLDLNDIGLVEVILDHPILVDCYIQNRFTGGVIFIDFISNLTVAAGMIKKIFNNNYINYSSFELNLSSFISNYSPGWNLNLNKLNN